MLAAAWMTRDQYIGPMKVLNGRRMAGLVRPDLGRQESGVHPSSQDARDWQSHTNKQALQPYHSPLFLKSELPRGLLNKRLSLRWTFSGGCLPVRAVSVEP